MAKKRFSVTVPPGAYEALRRLALANGDDAASIAAYLIQRGIDAAREKGEIPPAEIAEAVEERDLLIGFLNCLLDTSDHDGYSLSEIGALLGREKGDKDLIALIGKLQNKTGVTKS